MRSYDEYRLPTPLVSNGGAYFTGLNSSGTIVGNLITKEHFAVFTDIDGKLAITDSPPGSSISVGAINGAGVVAGTEIGQQNGIFELSGRTYIVLPEPQVGLVYEVGGINDAGVVAGTLSENDGSYDGFIDRNGTYTRLAIAGADTTALRVTAISNANAVAGYEAHSDGTVSGFVDNDGTVTAIVYPGSAYTIVTGINAAGTVVGYFKNGTLDASGAANVSSFIYSDGVYTRFDQSGSSDVEFHGITDSGLILGEAFDSIAQEERPFFMTSHGAGSPRGQKAATLTYSDAGTLTGETDFSASGGIVLQAQYGITGQSYTGTTYNYDLSGQLLSARYTGVTSQPYQAFETDYSNGAATQTKYFYTGITDKPYTTETLSVNAAGQQTSVIYGGVTGQPYSSYEYDFASGVLAGSKFTYTTVPAGAAYSTYETDYDFAGAYQGAKFVYTNITGQTYTGEEVDTTPTGATSRVLYSGFTGQPYQSLELDYTGGTYTSYKSFETGVTGQSYTGLEEDVTAAGQVTKVLYTGLNSTPYTTLEQDYTGGALSSSIFTFNAPAGQSYTSYAVTQNAAGTQISETVNNTNGSHTILGSAPNLIFESIGTDTITGGGAGETFAFHNVFGHDTLTDFYQHAIGAGHDTLDLSTADFTSFATLSASAQNVSGGVMFTGKSGSSITLSGVDRTTLTGLSADFKFHA